MKPVYMAAKIIRSAKDVQIGLQPRVLSAWYDRIILQTKEMAPPWLHDKIGVTQDLILPMKFRLNLSKRAVQYFMIAVDSNLAAMPYSTRQYFLRVQQEVATEMDSYLV